MTTVTVLGLGPMGHALATAFAAVDHPTTVWNRTPGKENGLDATVAATAAEAIEASPLVIVCVRDYAVAQSILDTGALKGRTLVNLSGGSPRQARAMATWAADHGIDYLDGVIMATTDAIGGPNAALFFSGPADVYETHRPTLAALGENAQYVGDSPGQAAAFDAALQDMLWTSMSGVIHMLALAKAENIAATDIAAHAKALLGFFPDMIDLLAEQVATENYSGDAGTLESTAATMDHILDAIRAQGLDNGVLSAARAHVGQAIDAGHGSDGFARLAAL
ncbi:NAD(P)-dependent oxidoreductase [Amycolatopsis roodepoortensis]|uniref:3-hydroxyisobutyrate dehydrogenase-like beta-hydroxyacid dehydrogenase n=1 Tax=Amycolatopsis roodepoortensis TaxID=700274 RepID=A0ABR9L362_9PSEU|nr:NAD(P)-binding domain-containing protein [Amycolatopsis roodepoortensis]MBE1574787.1 3-hydroxyisobutyrate dehydrogenase-like beta-hydroxyacid dehydrogenase [Amycolatopsis roodepoortensis]